MDRRLGWAVGYNPDAMIDRELLEILRCPACRATLTLNNEKQTLKCASCHRVYPIRDEIPILLVDQATVEE